MVIIKEKHNKMIFIFKHNIADGINGMSIISIFLIILQGMSAMNMFYKDSGERIRELRKKRYMTREQLSEKAEISPKFLYEIEFGKKGFSADTLYRLAMALNVSCDYIVSGNKSHIVSEEIADTLKMFNSDQLEILSNILKSTYEMIVYKKQGRAGQASM